MSTDYDRYFHVKNDSFTHDALNNMERAGTQVLDGLEGLAKDGHVPFRLMANDAFVAMMITTKTSVPLIPVAIPVIRQTFRQVAPQLLSQTSFTGAVLTIDPYTQDHSMGAVGAAERNPAIFAPLAMSIIELGTDPNWLVRISGLKGAPKSDNPRNAVLTVSGRSFYPEAYKVFADWIIKMPPVIREHGNTYIPPESAQLNAGELAKLTAGLSLSDYKHDHIEARQRIMSLQKIEVADYSK